ncbi:hypothetical protein D3C72_1593000 [compost metagenome]
MVLAVELAAGEHIAVVGQVEGAHALQAQAGVTVLPADEGGQLGGAGGGHVLLFPAVVDLLLGADGQGAGADLPVVGQPVVGLAFQAVVALLAVQLLHQQGGAVVGDALVGPGVEGRQLGVQGTVVVAPAEFHLLGLDPVQGRILDVHALLQDPVAIDRCGRIGALAVVLGRVG